MQGIKINKKVLVVGDANVDLIVHYPQLNDNGQTAFQAPVMSGGGTAANTAIALRKLGVAVDFMGTVGDDQYGQYALDEFIASGVGTEPLIIDKALNTVCVFAFIDEHGERYPWAWPQERESFKELNPERILWRAVEEAGWIHSSGMIMPYDTSARKSIVEIFKRAKEHGITTSFDLNLRVQNNELDESYRQTVLALLEYCDYVLGSGKEELYYLNPMPNWRDSAKSFVRQDRVVIARMGAKGSLALTKDTDWEELPFPVEVKDTVGAGDVYNAGFIAARLLGKSLRESIIWGNGVSGYKVARVGSRATPNLEELTLFLSGFGVQITI
ncbi:MAG: sugar kinase [Oscillospiraceae bacterium]|nr:sugar kinase [Oscillospiraceae bacterium]